MNVTPEPVPAEFRSLGEKITPPQRAKLIHLLNTKVPEELRYAGNCELVWKCLRISEDPEEFGMSKSKASELITYFERFRNIPEAMTQQEHEAAERQRMQMAGELVDIPDGYYALRMDGHKNDLTFYRLNTGKHGRWQGFQFIDMVVGHGKRYPQKGRDVRNQIFTAIREQGITDAQKLYGQEIGRCGRCGRELTDQTSRAFGIGPDCREIMGL